MTREGDTVSEQEWPEYSNTRRLNEKGKYGLGSYIYWMKENGLLDGNYLVQSITESRY